MIPTPNPSGIRGPLHRTVRAPPGNISHRRQHQRDRPIHPIGALDAVAGLHAHILTTGCDIDG